MVPTLGVPTTVTVTDTALTPDAGTPFVLPTVRVRATLAAIGVE
jgi:hypothetical protein